MRGRAGLAARPAGAGRVTGPRGTGQLRSSGTKAAAVHRADPGRQVVAGTRARSPGPCASGRPGRTSRCCSPLVTSTSPGRWPADIRYRAGLISPSAVTGHLVREGHDAANSGAASLVPQVGCQPAGPGRRTLVVDVDGPVAGRAHRDVGHAPAVGRPRRGPGPGRTAGRTAPTARSRWRAGGPVVAEDELVGRDAVGVVPHRVGRGALPLASRCSWVPPTAGDQGVAGRPGRGRERCR